MEYQIKIDHYPNGIRYEKTDEPYRAIVREKGITQEFETFKTKKEAFNFLKEFGYKGKMKDVLIL